MRRTTVFLLASFAVLAGVACGDQSSVGNQNLLQHIPSPSPVPSPSPSPKAAPSPVAVRTTQAPKPPPVAATATVDIITNSPYFQPQNLKIGHGTIVKFVNQDQQPDKVQILTGSGATVATSPQLMPGQSWSYTFSNTGSFQITDRRPYANGAVTVT
jgi:plastocyanin